MNRNLKSGSIFLPLLLVLSLSGLFLIKNVAVKSFADYQSDISQSVYNKFDINSSGYKLSDFMGDPSTWQFYASDRYFYKVKYPKSWKIDSNIKNSQENLDSFEAYLNNKVKLSVNVVKTLHIPKSINKSKFGENSFYFYEDADFRKSAAIQLNNLYYQIQLTQDNYFGIPQEFKAAFFQILKNFEFTN